MARIHSVLVSIAVPFVISPYIATGFSIENSLPVGWVRSSDDQTERFYGAGRPRPELRPEDLPTLLMTALSQNDTPYENAGLESMWHFAEGSATHHIFQHNVTDFIQSAFQRQPTSFPLLSTALLCMENLGKWKLVLIELVGKMVGLQRKS